MMTGEPSRTRVPGGRRSWIRGPPAGWNEDLGRPSANDPQILSVLQVVVVTADPVEVPECGRATRADRRVVIDLEMPIHVATRDHALGLGFLERGPGPGRDGR
jgi:hypothetical protein